jgi:hypothetical protein
VPPLTIKPEIEFVEIRQAYAIGGGVRAAGYFAFRVGAKYVTVEVSQSAMTTHGGGQLPPKKLIVAAEAFLGSEVERRGVDNLPENFVLTENSMDRVLFRLGFPSRF